MMGVRENEPQDVGDSHSKCRSRMRERKQTKMKLEFQASGRRDGGPAGEYQFEDRKDEPWVWGNGKARGETPSPASFLSRP